MALRGIVSRKFTSALKKVLNVPGLVNAKHASTKPLVFRDRDLEKMHKYYFEVNKDVFDKLNSAEFNAFIKMTVGRRFDSLDLRELFSMMDENKDEYISMREIKEHLQKGLAEQRTGDLKFAFCRFDKDFDDFIFLHEVREALFYLGFFHAGHPRVAEFFRSRDKDRDNRLTYEEFAELVTKDLPSLF